MAARLVVVGQMPDRRDQPLDFPQFPTILSRRFRTRLDSVGTKKMCRFNILVYNRDRNRRSPWPRAARDNGPPVML
jgi:hypothetical protein